MLLERYAELCPKQRKAPPAHSTLVPASTRHRVGERVYVVGEGDTLFDIAKYELGKATRWAEIYELNRDVLGDEFDYLRPGTELVLPHAGRDAESVTRGRDPGLQRVRQVGRLGLAMRIACQQPGKPTNCSRRSGGASFCAPSPFASPLA